MRNMILVIVTVMYGLCGAGDFSIDSRPSNHTFFTSAFGRYAKFGNKRGGFEQRYNSVATAVGYAYSRGCWEVGASFSFEHGKRKYVDGFFPSFPLNVNRSTNTIGLSLFGNYTLPSGWYGRASAFAGMQHTNNNLIRYRFGGSPGVWLPDGYAYRHNSGNFAVTLETGKRISIGDMFSITPHFGINYAVSTAEYVTSESLRVLIHDGYGPRHSLEIPVGITVQTEVAYGALVFAPFVDATFITRIQYGDNGFRPGFAAFDGREWGVYGLNRHGTGGRIKAGARIRYGERLDAGIEYAFETRRKYRDHRVSVSAGLSF